MPARKGAKAASSGPGRKTGSKHDGRTVREAMTPQPVAMIEVETVDKAASAMRENDVGAVLVLDDTTASLKGIVTDRDIVIRCVAEGKDPHMTTLSAIASTDVLTVSPDDPLDEALNLMRQKAVRRVAVMDDGGKPAGVISLGDISMELAPDSGKAMAAIAKAPPDS